MPITQREQEIIRERFTSEPDPDQLSLYTDDGSPDTMRDHRVPQPADRCQPVRKARAHE